MARKANTMYASDKTDDIVLSPSEGAKLITGMYLSGCYERTPLFRGAPGIGKTALVRAAVDELRKTFPKFHYVEINPTMPADEVAGIPDLVRSEGKPTRTDYAMPTWFPTAEANPEWQGIICLDDALQGDRMMQQTLANLIQARNLRGHALPKGAMIVATGNRVEDNAGVTRMLSHLSDRMTIFHIEADTMSWVNDYAMPNGVDERIIAYVHQYPDALNKFDPKAEKCPTSRTWAALSTRMMYLDSIKADPDMAPLHKKFSQAIVAGELGMAEGVKFLGFCDLWGKIPNIDDILKSPKEASIDLEVDVQYATAVAIAKKMNTETFSNALLYVNRLSADLTAMVVKLGAREKPELKDTEAFETWAVSNQELIHGYAN